MIQSRFEHLAVNRHVSKIRQLNVFNGLIPLGVNHTFNKILFLLVVVIEQFRNLVYNEMNNSKEMNNTHVNFFNHSDNPHPHHLQMRNPIFHLLIIHSN